jgi:hypothetical protein
MKEDGRVPHRDVAFGALTWLASSARRRTTTYQGGLLLLVAVWTASCGTLGEPETQFEVLLRVVERTSPAGVVTVIPVEELSAANRARGYNVGRFADGDLDFGVEFLSSQIQFEITNRSGTPATILWDSTLYLDAQGNEHRSFVSLEKSRSAIGPGKRLVVLGAPADSPLESTTVSG